ncbi:MAG: DegQ family serine endoprotease [Dongiaceae bacterium]
MDRRLTSPRRPTAVASAAATDTAGLRWLPALFALAGLMLAATAAQARSAPESFADLAQSLLPGVVNISTTQNVAEESITGEENLDQFFKDFFERQRRNNPQQHRTTSLGSGFVIDPTGYIVTNNHVIAEADEITVRFHDDSELKATLVGSDDKTDLALLKVETKTPIVSLAWGDSDGLRIGDWVLAIGNPFGLGGTVTAGIVSARNRILDQGGPYDDYIQTDASINRGNSGGPLFNMDGEVVGVNTLIYSNNAGGSVGIGFAIPSGMAKNVIAQIREFGRPRRGWLGVRIQTVNDELAEGLRLPQAKGALVANVTPQGPAEKAGIRQGDVILKFDGKEVNQMRTLPRMVAETPIRKKVDVVVIRQGKEMTMQVELGELTEEAEQASLQSGPEQTAPSAKEGRIAALGLTLSELSGSLRQKFSLAADAKGVVVTDVDQNSAAAEKGLHAGDVIVEVDQQAVATPADVDKRVTEAKDRGYRVVTLLLFREGDYQWVAVRIDRS